MSSNPTASEIRALSTDEHERYRGHLSLCEFDIPGQIALKRGCVAIVGCGGLGSPVALYLAAAGVGKIVLIDADTVSLSNLQRQIAHHTSDLGKAKTASVEGKMRDINPNVVIESHNCFLTSENAPSLIGPADFIVDCTDSRQSRRLVNDICVDMAKPYSFGAVSRFSGYLFTHTPGSATYNDIFGEETEGPDCDNEQCSCSATGVLNTLVGVVGSLQATEAIKYLTSTGELLTDRLLLIDTLTMAFRTLRISKNI